MADNQAEAQLAAFIAKYTPEMAALAETALAKLRARLPGAVELVYDNYNALAIGFGSTERASEVIFSLALYPRWVSLFFMQATHLRDPHNLLKGSGKVARHIVLRDTTDLDMPEIVELMAEALKCAAKPLAENAPNRLIIKSVSAKQRPRRPVLK